MRQYVLRVICAALLSGTAQCFVRQGMAKALVKLLCGALLAAAVLSPLSNMDLGRLPTLSVPGAAELTAAGESMAGQSRSAIIKSRCETYIMDKATALHGEIQVDITVDEEALPVAAVLSGRVSPDTKNRIEGILLSDLGIPKENVRWTF